MMSASKHPYLATRRFDGGNLDCGNGLLLLLRKHIDQLTAGQLLEIESQVASVADDLPAWCRLTNNQLVSVVASDRGRSFLVCKGPFTEAARAALGHASDQARDLTELRERPTVMQHTLERVSWLQTLPPPASVAPIRPLAVMGIGSWPRPPQWLPALHEQFAQGVVTGPLAEAVQASVRGVIAAQQRAGVDVLTDGEQWRDDYASFVAHYLHNCQLIPVQDLLPYLDHPTEFAESLAQLDVPAEAVRFPALLGPLGRRQPLALHELRYLQSQTTLPIKIALPGPYLLTRTMWMECFSDQAYPHREALAQDIVRMLREEVHELLAHGATLVQLDEPVLTEVVFGQPTTNNRSFMCGALSAKGPVDAELQFATDLIAAVVAGLPPERVAVHVCRGNWTADERAALAGDYRPLVPWLSKLPVGTLFLELCTPRAGEMSVLASLPESIRIGVGCVNQKQTHVESVEQIVAQAEQAIRLWGPARVLLNPDCGFATFADRPLASSQVAEAKLSAVVQAAAQLRDKYHIG